MFGLSDALRTGAPTPVINASIIMLEWPLYALVPALIYTLVLIVSSFFWRALLPKPIDHASGHSPCRMAAKSGISAEPGSKDSKRDGSQARLLSATRKRMAQTVHTRGY
jgi:hypothetical protein